MNNFFRFVADLHLTNFILLITPFIVVWATYRFGLATRRYEQKLKIADQRYTNLYLPFMDWLVHVPLDWADPGHYNPKVRGKLMKLLLDNAKYMGEDSASQLHSLYAANSNLDSLDLDRNLNFISAPREYSERFTRMTVTLLSEAQQLSNKLRLPDLAGSIYASVPSSLSIGQDPLKQRPNLKGK